MFRHATLAALLTLAPPALAQSPFEMPRADPSPLPGAAPSPNSPLDGLFTELFNRAQPHLDGLARDMGGLLGEYAPVFEELTGLMDDISNYEMPPERLANGDILIRRKAGAPPPPPLKELPNLLPKGGQSAPTVPPQAAPGTPTFTQPSGAQIEL